MLKRLVFMPLLLLLAACSGNAIFSENFEEMTEVPDILQTDGLVAVPDADNDVLHLIVTEAGLTESGIMTIKLAADASDYDVSMRVRVIAGSVRLWARRSDNCSGYVLILDTNLDNFRLSMVNPDNCDLQTIDTRSQLQVNTDQWYDMRITVTDNRVSAYVDGVRYSETESDSFPNGLAVIEVLNSRFGVGQVDIESLTVK
ncbi:MAG: hypothetical protein Q9P01_07770 [Anaerolineae bacterium]|nr:hypothetical protein [Anaerolineae bacterium]